MSGTNQYVTIREAIILLFTLATIFSCGWQKKLQENLKSYTPADKERDSSLIKSLSFVDSIVKANKKVKSYYCDAAVLFVIEKKTGIASSGDGSIIGKKFTRQDWLKWHEWFGVNYRKNE